MKPSLTRCPICGEELTVVRYRCDTCDITIDGRFAHSAFAGLTAEQLDFIETFVRCEGKLTRLQEEFGLSYPTLRNRLHEVIRALGYEPGREEGTELSEERRRAILEDLDAGKITAEEAMRLLQGEE